MGAKSALAAIIGLGLTLSPAALAAKPAATGRGSASTGYDISWPQCTTSYPANPAFGIVVVNGGLANDANQCSPRSCSGRSPPPA
jgi:hypothetical protein